jgi:sulfide dehydrogenase cytochrome subunit
MACHGKDGVSADTNMPTISGFSPKYFQYTMKSYKEKTRLCRESEIPTGDLKGTKTDMCKIVEGLSEEDSKAISKFFTDKKFVKANQKFDAALAEKGKAIHKESCEKCHSDGGSKASDDAGILAGQQMGYMEATLKEFAAEKRPMEKKMKAKYESLDNDSFTALTHYYGSLK